MNHCKSLLARKAASLVLAARSGENGARPAVKAALLPADADSNLHLRVERTLPDPDAWQSLSFGPFTLNVSGRTLHCRTADVRLAPKEFDLLVLLARFAGALVTKQEIVRALWPGTTPSDAAFAQTLYRLRSSLAKHDAHTSYVATIPGRGYQFIQRVAQSRG